MDSSIFWDDLSYIIFPSPLLFLLVAVALKCLLISGYLWILFYAVRGVKKLARGKIGVRGGYYLWYLLLLCLPLSGFSFNGALKLPIYSLYAGDWFQLMPMPRAWYVCGVLAILWLLIVYYRVTAHIVTSLKLEGAISSMLECDALESLKQKAANMLGLRSKRIQGGASDAVYAPISCGVFKKTIMLPRDYESRYSESELFSLLLHEMTHIKNDDAVKLHLLQLVGCLLILPPGLMHDFKRDTEILCDNRVMSVQHVDTDTYASLMVRECSGKATAIKGLAFSDSFRAIESRIDAIYSYPPAIYRFAVFPVIIILVLLTVFGWRCVAPASWFVPNKPSDRKLDVLVTFTDEESWEEVEARRGHFEETGVFPPPLQDRPDTAYFDGTYERLADGTVQIDRLALRDAVLPIEKQGAKVNEIWFIFYKYTLSADHPYYEEYPVFIDELLDFDESERYQFRINDPNESYRLQDQIYALAAHWL
jgi:beta-lactamase regulating signal transducer with metallopeptidase domain